MGTAHTINLELSLDTKTKIKDSECIVIEIQNPSDIITWNSNAYLIGADSSVMKPDRSFK